MDDVKERDNKWCCIIAAVVSNTISCVIANERFIVEGKLPNHTDANNDAVVKKIFKLKQTQRMLFTRIYHLSPTSFDWMLAIIESDLLLKNLTAKYFVLAIIKLCLGLRVIAGVSYLVLLFGYDVLHGTVHHYAWQALHAIDCSTNFFLDHIKSPIYATIEQLEVLEDGFGKMSNY